MPYPIKERLLEIPLIAEQPEEVLNWLTKNGEYRFISEGEFLFRKGDKIEHMLILLEGEVAFMVETGGNFLNTGSAGKGEITGLLPFSRMKEAGAHSQSLMDLHALAIHKSKFQELDQTSPSLMQKLVEIMSDRIRIFTTRQQQREKMEALGKMSAGIAHELNNPASAIRSTSRELEKKWNDIQDITKKLMCSGIGFETISQAKAILANTGEKKTLSPVEKSELEDELIDLMDDYGFEDSLDLAEVLVEKQISTEQLSELKDLIDSEYLESLLRWFTEGFNVNEMIKDINDASERISNLVGSIKTHSHMDRAPEMGEVDIRKGIESTLVIFQHKLKDKEVDLQLKFDDELPKIMAHEGELNQVWTNMIDNAIDAMNGNGVLSISAIKKGKNVELGIQDNGSGIPEDIQAQIFDPFFTTKGIGKGSGLGLDISKRIIDEHRGVINLESKPGMTKFTICLPIEHV